MNRFKKLISICALTVVGGSTIVLGLPPDPEEANWKGPRNNCYNYATDTKSNDFKQPGGFPWENAGANLTAPAWCTKVTARAVGDGLVTIAWTAGDPIPEPPTGFNLVALGGLAGVKGGGGDYHWWRRNADGTWSHKRGATPAKATYTDGANNEVPITDPRAAAQRDGYDLCGFMGVAKVPVTERVDPSAPTSDETRVGPITNSGVPSPGMYIPGSDLQPTIPLLDITNEVPDPQWTGVIAGDSAGFGVWAGIGIVTPTFPPYMRVFQGVVAVYDDLDGTTITYYNDNNGMEAFLAGLVMPVGACCILPDPNECAVTTEAECRGLGRTYRGHGTDCSDPEICNVPAVSEWGMIAMVLLVLTAATVIMSRRRAFLEGHPMT
jgi:hypothetical protein